MTETSTDPRVTRFGVMGTGRITRRLVADLQSIQAVKVTAIASRSQDRADWFASQYGIPAAVKTYHALLERDDVDAIYLSLPPSMHREWCVRAAQAGKHVLCEKPLALNAGEVVELHRACQSTGVRWLDATGWPHHARTHRMRELVQNGTTGTLGHLSVAVSFFRPFQSGEHRLEKSLGGGCLLDLGWYAAGLCRYFVGDVPRRVFADSILENGVPIRTNAMLWFDSDITASLSCGYDTATRKWCEIAGSEASVICDDFTRPWADRATRFWVHQASGEVQANEVPDSQECRMIERLIGNEPLDDFHLQALQTQAILDALDQSSVDGVPTSVLLPSF
ncbi:MAG: Gfo/Idh/MocA family oxidoreductase [Planctomycetota bacterium]